MQGKEDLTPRVAALREHNESQSSGVGMLRAGKTTPSRLRALFTSSKVANATLPGSKKDDVRDECPVYGMCIYDVFALMANFDCIFAE